MGTCALWSSGIQCLRGRLDYFKAQLKSEVSKLQLESIFGAALLLGSGVILLTLRSWGFSLWSSSINPEHGMTWHVMANPTYAHFYYLKC